MTYTGLITSEHAQKPKFSALVDALTSPLAALVDFASSIYTAYDIDSAIGAQLDVLGLWIGASRSLRVPVTGVFFSLDVPPGLDSGIIYTSQTPADGLESLPDEHYRLVLKAKILRNQWDGSMAQAYEIYNALFAGSALSPFVQDNANMTMLVGLTGAVPDALTLALLTQGLLDARPAGVRVISYVTTSSNAPIFALDVQNTLFGGLDFGAVAIFNPPS